MDKAEKNALKQKAKQQHKAALEASLPIARVEFLCLFDHLDERLQAYGCDDTLRYTVQFLEDNRLPVEPSIDWMQRHGGGCDCEVLANLEDLLSE